MSPSAMLHSLPIELCALIVDYAHDLITISCLSRTCKRNYRIFIPFLYSKVDHSALSTLSLSAETRAFLNLPHPASFVKDLHLAFYVKKLTAADLRNRFQRESKLALKNIVEQSGGTSPLKRLSIDTPPIAFPRVFGQLDAESLRNLVHLSLICEFPDNTFKKSLSILSSLLNQNLTFLHLDVLECKLSSRTPKPQFLSQLLSVIAETCSNLTSLGLAIPVSARAVPDDQDADPVNEVLKKMNFPSLRSLLVQGHGAAALRKLDFVPFIANHPLLEGLQYYSSRLIPDDLVPSLKSFTGDMENAIRICHSKRPFCDLTTRFYAFPDEDLECALQRAPTLRRLSLTCDSFYPMPVPLMFLTACTQITHLELKLNDSVRLPVVYRSLTQNLPRLETFKISVREFLYNYTNGIQLEQYGEEIVEYLVRPSLPHLRNVTIEMRGWFPEEKSWLTVTFVFTVHPCENGVVEGLELAQFQWTTDSGIMIRGEVDVDGGMNKPYSFDYNYCEKAQLVKMLCYSK